MLCLLYIYPILLYIIFIFIYIKLGRKKYCFVGVVKQSYQKILGFQ